MRRHSVKPQFNWNKDDPYQDMPELNAAKQEDAVPEFSDLDSHQSM